MKISPAFAPVLAFILFTGCAPVATPPGKPATHAYAPAKGSPERTTILAGVRAARDRQGLKNVVLFVPSLQVHGGWAWVRVNPQSADGKNHYESQSGLLREKAKKWTLLEWMPSEEGTDYAKYFHDLRAKYPAAPADIFPK